MSDVAAASELLKPYDARVMWCYPVGTRINQVANDDEQCECGEALTIVAGSVCWFEVTAPNL